MTGEVTKIGDMAAKARTAGPSTPFAPFRHRVFTVLWLATVLSNVGTWMHDVAAGWLMTSLAPSPLMVALVQTATTLPVFLLALPAGALGDILDRRRMLIVAQATLSVIAGLLGVIVLAGLANPWLLLIFTFAMGAGTALTAPAWQAIVPRLVPRDTLQPALAMNSVGINISRAIGPALAGVIITTVGIAVPFLANAFSYLVIVAALIWWPRQTETERHLPPEQLFGAIRTGLRYAWHSLPLRATLGRAIGYFVFASASWAMLPLIVRKELGGGAELYGIMLGCVGVGAVSGAFVLPRLRARLGSDRLVAIGTVGMAFVLVVFATVQNQVIASLASLVAGASWIAVLTSLNVSAQVALPDWVRARGLSIFVMIFFGSMSGGSLLWGQTANLLGIPSALLIAAAGAVVVLPFLRRWKLQQPGALDLDPSLHWPDPVLSRTVEHDRGPVLVTIEYRIDPAQSEAFVATMYELMRERRRDGAHDWGIFEDVAADGRFIETFLVDSWLEHLRHHDRVTKADADIQKRAGAFHIGEVGPVVQHFIAPPRDV